VNRKEAVQLIGIATANFPNMQERDMGPTAALWHQILEDIPYPVAEAALFKVLSTARYFPTVAEILEAALYVTQPLLPTAPEAWAMVMQAVNKHGMYRQQQTMDMLPDFVQQVVKTMGLRQICLSEEPDIVRAQFIKSYDVMEKRHQETAQLPPRVLELVRGVNLKSISGSNS
jgi:hypothetical protein